jgi:hypothetical protein
MAVPTCARIGVKSEAIQMRSGNASNVGFDKGMLKGFGQRAENTERRRSLVRDFSGAKRPLFFLGAVGATDKRVKRVKPIA